MPAILPLIVLTVLCLTFRERSNGWRSAILAAAITWGCLLTAVTEILSLLTLLTFGWLVALWGLCSVVCTLIYIWLIRTRKRMAPPKKPSEISSFSILLLLGVILIVAVIGVIAWVSPPNNEDSMLYHMSRVMHWAQNHSVAHYSTANVRQLILSPWAEFAIMHFQILSDGDRFANLVQWLSLVGSLVGVSLLAEHLGANTHGQILAVVVCATLPMGILQGSSTQNDATVAFWLICLVYYLMLVRTRPHGAYACAAGVSLGLALLTKATAYIIAPPFLVWFASTQLKTLRWTLWKPIFMIAIVTVSLNLGHYARNIAAFGHPLNPGREITGWETANEAMTLSLFVSNVVRNVGLHIGMPSRRLRLGWLNHAMERGVDGLHTVLGVDVNDPRTTWEKTKFRITGIQFHEDRAGNPIHLILIVMSIALFLLSRQKMEPWHLTVSYAFSVTAGFLLMTLYIKWEPWNSRYHLPLFMLWSPFIGCVLSNHLNRMKANAIAVTLILASFPWVVYNWTRPLLGSKNIFNVSRVDAYFSNRPDLREPYIDAAQFVQSHKCSQIGLILSGSSYEYPLWVLLQRNNNEVIQIEDVKPKSHLPVRLRPNFNRSRPCAIIAVNAGQGQEIVTEIGAYAQAWSSDLGRVDEFRVPVSVFIGPNPTLMSPASPAAQ
jgi:hypothetical protein